ncbi:hypothetical protein ACLOJK_014996, partial [Asimina triloba]
MRPNMMQHSTSKIAKRPQRDGQQDVGHNQSKQATASKGRPSNQLAEIPDNILANDIAAVHLQRPWSSNIASSKCSSRSSLAKHMDQQHFINQRSSSWPIQNNSKFLNKFSQQQGGDALGHQQGRNFTFNSSNFSTCKLRPCSHHVQAEAATNVQTIQHGFVSKNGRQSNQKIRKLRQLHDFGCGLEFSPINKVEAMAAKAARRREWQLWDSWVATEIWKEMRG